MKLIEREMVTREIVTDKGETALYCQASFNSDGNMTLRNYNINDKTSDEIIILSAEETQAIIKLFSEIKKMTSTNDLPF